MRSMLGQLIRTGAVCGMLMIMNPFTSMASIGPGFTAGTYVATITSESVNINRNMDSEEVLMTARTGNTYEVLEDLGNGWMKVRVNDTEGYLPVSGNATVKQVTEDEIAVMDGGKCILQIRGARPFFSDKYDITKHPHYRYLADADPKNWYRSDKEIHPMYLPKPEEEVEVIEVDLSQAE